MKVQGTVLTCWHYMSYPQNRPQLYPVLRFSATTVKRRISLVYALVRE